MSILFLLAQLLCAFDPEIKASQLCIEAKGTHDDDDGDDVNVRNDDEQGSGQRAAGSGQAAALALAGGIGSGIGGRRLPTVLNTSTE